MAEVRRFSTRLMMQGENPDISKADLNKNKDISDKNRKVLGAQNASSFISNFTKKKIIVDEVDKKERKAEIIKVETVTVKKAVVRKDSSCLLPEEFEDIGHHLHFLEQQRALPITFLDNSVVSARMRQILVDWMMMVHERFGLEHETFHLGVTLLDRCFYVMKNIKKGDLQLLAATCMFLASKYEEVSIPHIGDFVYMADNSFTAKDMFRIESKIFAACHFNVNFPLAVTFLRRYRYYLDNSKTAHFYSKMIMDLAHFDAILCCKLPSIIAICANYLSYVLVGTDFPFSILSTIGFTKSKVLHESSDFVDRVISFMSSKKDSALRRKYGRIQISMDLTDEQKNRLLALKFN